MPIIHIESLTHPGVEVFSTLTEAQLRRKLEPGKGIFIAESPKVIRVALDAAMSHWLCCARSGILQATRPTSLLVVPIFPFTQAVANCWLHSPDIP